MNPTFECQLCVVDPYTSDERAHVKRHITKSKDELHKDKTGDSPGTILVTEEADVEEPGQRHRETAGNATYEGPPGGIDATMTHLAEISQEAGDTVKDVDVTDATLIAVTDDQLIDILSAETVDKEAKRAILDQIREQ